MDEAQLMEPINKSSVRISRVRRMESSTWTGEDWRISPAVVVDLKHQTFVKPTIELFNIPFNIRQGDEYVFLESPQWPSLQSFGHNATEAISSMLDLLRHVIKEFVLAPQNELAEDAIEFKKYLIETMSF